MGKDPQAHRSRSPVYRRNWESLHRWKRILSSAEVFIHFCSMNWLCVLVWSSSYRTRTRAEPKNRLNLAAFCCSKHTRKKCIQFSSARAGNILGDCSEWILRRNVSTTCSATRIRATCSPLSTIEFFLLCFFVEEIRSVSCTILHTNSVILLCRTLKSSRILSLCSSTNRYSFFIYENSSQNNSNFVCLRLSVRLFVFVEQSWTLFCYYSGQLVATAPATRILNTSLVEKFLQYPPPLPPHNCRAHKSNHEFVFFPPCLLDPAGPLYADQCCFIVFFGFGLRPLFVCAWIVVDKIRGLCVCVRFQSMLLLLLGAQMLQNPESIRN